MAAVFSNYNKIQHVLFCAGQYLTGVSREYEGSVGFTRFSQVTAPVNINTVMTVTTRSSATAESTVHPIFVPIESSYATFCS